MTTIAATKTQIAGDLQLTHANGIIFKSNSKLRVYDVPVIYPKKFAVGYAGNVELAHQLLTFFDAPDTFKLPKKWQDCEFLVLTEDHKLYTFCDPRKWLLVDSPYYAMGSGSHFAMGALQSGKSAVDAVKVAIKLDKSSGFGTSRINFP